MRLRRYSQIGQFRALVHRFLSGVHILHLVLGILCHAAQLHGQPASRARRPPKGKDDSLVKIAPVELVGKPDVFLGGVGREGIVVAGEIGS